MSVYTYIRVKKSPQHQGGKKMTAKEIRKIVKNNIIAQGGKLYNYNLNNIRAMYGVNGTELQNAVNYFQYSPQQAKFRATYNFR